MTKVTAMLMTVMVKIMRVLTVDWLIMLVNGLVFVVVAVFVVFAVVVEQVTEEKEIITT